MIDIDGVYVSHAAYLMTFKKLDEQVRFKQAQAEKAFGGFFHGQSIQTNVPDDFDPNAARILFNSAPKSLAISKASCQLNFGFEPSLDLSKQIEVVRKNIADFHSRAFAFKEQSEFGLNALVIGLQFRSTAGKDALHGYLYNQLIKVSPVGKLASLAVNFGFEVEQKFINVEASVYELRRADFKGQPGTQIVVNILDVPVVEEGISFKIDVNNRPKVQANPTAAPEDPRVLFDLAIKFMKHDLPNIAGIKNILN